MNCIVFSSETGVMVEANRTWNGIIEYSYDNVTWSVWYGRTIANNVIYMRGVNNTVVSNGEQWQIKGINVRCEGNIENLLDYKLVEQNIHPPMEDNCFAYMFSHCESLITSPKLSAIELADTCYTAMFASCTSLITAPELPAKELCKDCYSYMFYNCTSLLTTPMLFATTLAESCYESMFEDCCDLTTASDLPATQLEKFCYVSMFAGCTSLVNVGGILATDLAEYCWDNMFYNCISLLTTPAFANIQVAVEASKENAFFGCKNLEHINVNNKNYNINTLRLY